MQIAAIIAARHEIPENVRRTVEGLKAHGVRVQVIEDKRGEGCGVLRHRGIMAAKTKGVFLCDAHMAFDEGYFDHIKAHLARRPQDVTCSRMMSITHDWADIPGQIYCGAEIQTEVAEVDGTHMELAAKWRRTDTGDGPIGAVMGACYGMTRDQYAAMGQPLSILQAWGRDEEALSAACWMTGGKVYLLPGMARHMYAAPRVGGRGLSKDEEARVWSNRAALLSAIPMPEQRTAALVACLRRNPYAIRNRDAINAAAQARAPEIERMYAALAAGPVTWETYEAQMCNTMRDTTPEELSRRQGVREADAARNRPAPAPAPTPQPAPAPAVEIDLGAVACLHCAATGGHAPAGAYPNGNTRWMCRACGVPFIRQKGGV